MQAQLLIQSLITSSKERLCHFKIDLYTVEAADPRSENVGVLEGFVKDPGVLHAWSENVLLLFINIIVSLIISLGLKSL